MLRSALLEASSQFNMIVRNNKIQKVVLFKKVYIYICIYIIPFLYINIQLYNMWAKLLQSCPTLCDPMDCRPPGSSVHGDSPGKNNGVGRHALLQGIFPTQGSNPSLPNCRWILYHLSHQGNP